jgi:membrane protein required for beta-lactamase induction
MLDKGDKEMKHRLTDMHDLLFEQLERLSKRGLSREELAEEVRTARALADIAQQILATDTLIIAASKLMSSAPEIKLPKMIEESIQ